MKLTKRLVAVALAVLMIFGSFSVALTASAAGSGSTLGITTKFFRSVNGVWTVTDKVVEGEEVKLGVYLDTDYYAGDGSILLYYNSDFFEESYSTSQQTLTVGDNYSKATYDIAGNFSIGSDSHAGTISTAMYNNNAITQDYMSNHEPIYITYKFGESATAQMFDGKELFCEISLTVKTAPTAAEGLAEAIEATAATADFQRGKINIGKSEAGGDPGTADPMWNWKADLDFFEEPVTLFTNSSAVSFDANQGKFSITTEKAVANLYAEGEAGEAIDQLVTTDSALVASGNAVIDALPTPTRDGYTFKGWKVAGEDDATAVSEVTVYPEADTEYVAVWEQDENLGNKLNFRTEIYREDENGEWVYTEKVKPGEKVRARLFIDTEFNAGNGEILFVYDGDFFEDDEDTYAYDSPVDADTNTSPTSSVAAYGITGTTQKLSATNRTVKDLVDAGYLDEEFLKNHPVIVSSFMFPPNDDCQVISGDEWFIQYDLTVKENAVGEGDFYVYTDTVCTTEDGPGYWAYTTVGKETENSTKARDAENMTIWDADVTIESNPVSIYNTIVFNANGGEFAADDTQNYVISGTVGEAVDYSTIPEVSRDGWTFMGWIDASDETPTLEEAKTADQLEATMTYNSVIEGSDPEAAIIYNAFWVNKIDITFANINPETEETEVIKTESVTVGDPFIVPEDPSIEGYRFVGWTTEWDDENNLLGALTGLPEKYPAAATTYYAVYTSMEYSVNYYVLDADIENPTIDDFELAGHVNAEYGSVIPAVPSGYNAPEGYVLSVAYTDVVYADQIVFADANKFVTGTTMPAHEYNLYYKLERGEFEAVFDANEGAWADGETTKTVLAVYGEEIALPEEPTREGYVFVGWEPSVSIMDQEGKTFKAAWENDIFNATYYVDGAEYETYEIAYEDVMDVPADPYKEGHKFLGWADAADSTTVVTLPAAMPAGDVNYYAVFEVIEYTIKFADTGDTVMEDITLPYGTEIPAVEEPVKEGYTFKGWAETQGAGETAKVDLPATMPVTPEEGKTYYAIWVINEYTVTWVVDGTEIVDTYDYLEPIVKPADPEKTGYEFDGWTPEFPEEGKLMPAEDLTYTAVWLAKTYNATFLTVADGETHDGAWADGSTSADVPTLFNEAIVAPTEVPVRTGYTFAGWDPIVGTMDEEGKTFTAVWTPNANTEYKVEFYSMDTTGAYKLTDTQTRTGTSDTVIDLVVSAPTNYKINKDESTYDDGITIAPDGSTVVTVYFERDLFTITFDGNNGTVDGEATKSAEYRYGAAVVVPAVERTGYTFIGWADAPENGNAVEVNLTAVETVTYYAQWEINQYTITFDTVGGTEIPAITKDYGEAVGTVANPTKLGHEFVAWDKEIPPTMPAEDITITASWNPLAWDATFDAGEGKFADDSTIVTVEDVTFGDAITAPAEEPTREGYDFNGWLDADGNPVGTMDDEGKEFFADWKINQYTITFDTKGGTEIEPITQDYATAVTAPADPTKEGYTFKNWDVAVPEAMPAGDMTITAVWEANEYTITFEDTGDTVIGPITQAYESAVTAPDDPEKTGYEFAGWSPEVPETMPLNGATITATWTPKDDTEYKVVVNYTDAATGAQAVEFLYTGTTDNVIAIVDAIPDPEAENTEYVLMSDLAVKGYVLDTEAENDLTGVVAADGSTVLNLYYVATKVTATFDANGGAYYDATTSKSAEIDYNALVAPVAPAGYDAPTQEGYTFGGWQGLNDSTRLQADRTFQAIWNANQYTLTWDLNGSDVEGGGFVQTDDYKALVNEQTYEVREGYTFIGWVDENGAEVIVPDTIPAENLTIIAKYEVDSYDIIWDDGTKTTTENKEYGSAIVEPAYEPTKEGYKFDGWATAEGKTPAEVATVPVDGVEFEAQWTKNNYYVEYYVIDPATGEFDAAVAAATVPYGDPISTVVPGYTAPAGYSLVNVAYTDTGFTAPLADGATMPAADVNLYYDLVANEYPAVFDANGGAWADGDTTKTVETAYNETIVAPAAPSLEGNEFAGWTPAVGTMDDVNGKQYVASWTPKIYTVTYKANGGIWGEGEAIETTQTFEVVYGTAIPAPEADPTRTGYTFKGWDKTAPAAMPAEDLVFTAQWEIKSATITFNTDGGSTVNPITQDYGTAVTAPADPTKTGYTFTGWDTAVPATMPEADMTINATWKKNTYTVTWIVDGNQTVDKYAFGDAIVKPADPEKAGYTFGGWTPEVAATMPAEDQTYTATWTAKEITVTFDAAGGTGAWGENGEALDKITVKAKCGEALTAPADPTRDGGYAFGGWNPAVPATMPTTDTTYTATWITAAEVSYKVNSHYMDTTGAYTDSEEEGTLVVSTGLAAPNTKITVSTAAPEGFAFDADNANNAITGVVAADGSAEFHVYYERKSYTITFEGNNGTINGNPNKTGTYLYGSTVVEPTAVRTGYDFAGWADAAENGNAVAVNTTATADATYYAQWTEATYTATFKALPGAFPNDDGTAGETTETTEFVYGNAIEEPATDPVRDGYTFDKWVDENGNTPADLGTDVADDVTFTATWTANYYDAVFYMDETKAEKHDTKTAQYNTNYNVPTDPTKTGYTFTGWVDAATDKAAGLPAAGELTAMPLNGAEYYATWEVVEYNLVYRANGGSYEGEANLTYKVPFGTAKADMPVPAEPTREGYSFTGYNAELPETMPAEQVNLVAQWTKNSYNATFDAIDGTFESTGETTETVIVPFEDTLYAPEEVPLKDGYEFSGWKDEDGNVYNPGDEIGPMGAEDITLKAEWTAVDSAYTVKHFYMDNEGNYPAEPAAEDIENLAAATDSTVTAAEKPKDNFTFDAAASTVSGVVTADDSLVLELYYVREKNTLTIYDEEGNVLDTEEVYFEAPLSVDEPTKEGYTFAGWTDAAGEDAEVPAAMPGEALDIYESWTINSYGVIFDANTGAWADGDTTKTVATNYAAAVTAPVDSEGNAYVPVKAGHTFKGWFDAKENGNSVDTYTSMPELADGETLTFYARWEANKNDYTIEIYQMNPDGSMPTEPTSMVINNALVGETIVIKEGEDLTVPAGFTLDEANSVLTGVVPAEDTLVLKVVLVRAPHKFTAIVDGVKVVDNREYYFDQTVDQIATPTKDGYTFVGWTTTDPGPEGGVIEEGAVADAPYPARMPNNDVTIYGVWSTNSYNAIFNAGDGMFENGTEETTDDKPVVSTPVNFGDTITAPTEVPVREGFEFGGWEAEDGTVYQPGEAAGTMGKDGAEFEAVWNKSSFTVTFYGYEALTESPYKSANATKVLGEPKTYAYGASIEFPADPDNIDAQYYTFVGWAKTENGTVLSNSELYNQTMPAEDVAYYAVYERVKVMLIRNDDAQYWTDNNTNCTTVIDRAGGTVDDYPTSTEPWYVYGLTDRMLVETTRDAKRLDTYIDVSGDGYYEVVEFKVKDGSVGTGTVINVYDNVSGELVESFWIIIYGDLNGDGAITTLDYSIAQAEVAGDTSWSYVIDTENYCHYKAKAAELNGDGLFSVTDAAQINYYVLGTVKIDQTTGRASNNK